MILNIFYSILYGSSIQFFLSDIYFYQKTVILLKKTSIPRNRAFKILIAKTIATNNLLMIYLQLNARNSYEQQLISEPPVTSIIKLTKLPHCKVLTLISNRALITARRVEPKTEFIVVTKS